MESADIPSEKIVEMIAANSAQDCERTIEKHSKSESSGRQKATICVQTGEIHAAIT